MTEIEIREEPRQILVRLLKEKGVEDPETKKFLDQWTREQEKLVEQSDDPAEASIYFNLRRARLYFEAGYIEEALDTFESARTQAWNENRNELYDAIMKDMDEVEDSL